MTSQYIVIKYGNVITGEYLNIGVVAFDINVESPIYFKFTENLQRIMMAFGWQDHFGEAVLKHTFEDISKIINKTDLFKYIEKCESPYSSLQFTSPRASLTEAKYLVDEVSKDFLR